MSRFARRAEVITARGQKAAEALMVDHVDVSRVQRVRDPETYVESVVEVAVWSGPCKVQTYEPDAIDRVSAGRPVVSQEDRLHVPVTAGPFEIGDIARVTGLERPCRIDGLLGKTFQTAQRLKVNMIANSEVTDGFGDG